MLYLCKRLLQLNFRVHFLFIVMGQIFPVQIIQSLRHIHIAVQINIAVGGMIVFLMECQKILIGKIRNILRVTAGLHAIGGIRVQGIHHYSLQHFIRGGKCSLHFVVNHAVYGKRRIFVLHFVVPAFLTENLFFLINIGMEYRIQIDIHQIFEIRIVAACQRIYGLVRIGHGI